jgi:hypothetical protein
VSALASFQISLLFLIIDYTLLKHGSMTSPVLPLHNDEVYQGQFSKSTNDHAVSHNLEGSNVYGSDSASAFEEDDDGGSSLAAALATMNNDNHNSFEDVILLNKEISDSAPSLQQHYVKPPSPPSYLLQDPTLLPTPPLSPSQLAGLSPATTAVRRPAASSSASLSSGMGTTLDVTLATSVPAESSVGANTTTASSTYAWVCAERRKRLLMHTMAVMNFLGKLLIWTSFMALVAGIIWYSLELKHNGTEQHLIAWFSAGAFVILGFPISIWGIVMHLTHYYRPNIQCHIVRVLWMVPIYSIGSWLCLRFNDVAIYIETIRDCYEAFVLYSFFQFLINVLGGERELILLLKEKSPTRGAHMWGMQWCAKPWIMGQPLVDKNNNNKVVWTSPFYVKCKFGVLQYVLLKNLTAWLTMILEFHGLYKEGDFSLSSAYFYITFVINWSQCWALYCLILFYYALKNELAPISPVGKFLAVKSLIFFTWWQSLAIAVLSTLGMIPSYQTKDGNVVYDEEDVAKIIQYYLICIEMFGSAILHYFVFPHTEWADSPAQQVAAHTHTGRGHRLGRYRKQRAAAHLELQRLRQTRQQKDEEHVSLLGGTLSGDSSTGSGMRSRTATGSSTISDFLNRMKDGTILPRPPSPNPHAKENPNSPRTDPSSARGSDAGDDEMSFASGSTHATEVTRNHPLRPQPAKPQRPTGFVRALIESTVPMDVVEDSANMVKGHYVVQKQTLLNHASASDDYALFVPGTKGFVPRPRGFSPKVGGASPLTSRVGAAPENQLQQPSLGIRAVATNNLIPRPTRKKQPKEKESPQGKLEASASISPEEIKRNKNKKRKEDELAALNFSGGAVSFVSQVHR